jgi:hypothetical protein
VLWVKAGGSLESVVLAADLVGAIRDRRRDLRIVLTFDVAHADALRRLDGMRRVGVGFGPADDSGAIRRMLRRLSPIGLVEVATVPGPALSAALTRHAVHHVVVCGFPGAGSAPEWVLARSQAQYQDWMESGSGGVILGPCDPLTLLTEAQLEPRLRALIGCDEQRPLIWLHAPPEQQLRDYVEAWHAAPAGLDTGVLVIASDAASRCGGVLARLAGWGGVVVPVTTWDRKPIPNGAILLLDDARWVAPVAVACDAAILVDGEASATWQALAAGTAVIGGAAFCRRWPSLADVPRADGPRASFRRVSELLSLPGGRRRLGDAGRRRFWLERRRAAEAIEQLLATIREW